MQLPIAPTGPEILRPSGDTCLFTRFVTPGELAPCVLVTYL